MPHVRPALTATAVTLALAACQDASGPTATVAPIRRAAVTARGSEPIPGAYIVRLRDDVTDPPGHARRLAAQSGGSLKHVYQAALKGFALRLPGDAAVAALRADPAVAYVEQDQTVHLVDLQTEANPTWGLDRIDQHGLPLDHAYSYLTTGAGVTAYIIDTGILYGHAELTGRAVPGVDEVTAGGGAVDCNGHGTHVSGTVGGTRYGVAKGVRLVGVRVLDCSGNGTVAGVIAGVDWVTTNHATGAPAVANMSLGGGASTALDDAVRGSIADGVTYAIAAGNGDPVLGLQDDACRYSPARVAEALTVSATDSTDAKPYWANYGSCVDLFAPGVGITSSYYNSADPSGTNWYAVLSGTSMATPHVAGAAARYLEQNPSASPAAVATALAGNATTGKVTSAGSASPNRLLYTAFMDGGTVPTPTDAPPTASIAKSCSGLSCTFTSTSTDDHGIAAQQWTVSGGSVSGGSTTGASVTVGYKRNASGTVALKVTDTAGQNATASASVSCSAKACR